MLEIQWDIVAAAVITAILIIFGVTSKELFSKDISELARDFTWNLLTLLVISSLTFFLAYVIHEIVAAFLQALGGR